MNFAEWDKRENDDVDAHESARMAAQLEIHEYVSDWIESLRAILREAGPVVELYRNTYVLAIDDGYGDSAAKCSRLEKAIASIEDAVDHLRDLETETDHLKANHLKSLPRHRVPGHRLSLVQTYRILKRDHCLTEEQAVEAIYWFRILCPGESRAKAEDTDPIRFIMDRRALWDRSQQPSQTAFGFSDACHVLYGRTPKGDA